MIAALLTIAAILLFPLGLGLLETALILGPYIALRKFFEWTLVELNAEETTRVAAVEMGIAAIGVIVLGEAYLLEFAIECVLDIFAILIAFDKEFYKEFP